MKNFEKPREVQDARKRGDHDALSAMGTKGGINAGLLRKDRKMQEEAMLDERIAELERVAHIDENGDVLPPLPPDQMH